MKRDLDLIRTILLDIEECDTFNPEHFHSFKWLKKWQNNIESTVATELSEEYVAYQIKLIQENGLFSEPLFIIENAGSGITLTQTWKFFGLSSIGHDFLKQIKDEKRFVNKIKPVISKLGGWTFDNIFDISRAIDKIDIPNIVSKMFG
jgi:hypothetical protein